jgi:hypothetical protein
VHVRRTTTHHLTYRNIIGPQPQEKQMSGQTLRENISQDVQYLLRKHYGEVDWPLHELLVDWAVTRAEADKAEQP